MIIYFPGVVNLGVNPMDNPVVPKAEDTSNTMLIKE